MQRSSRSKHTLTPKTNQLIPKTYRKIIAVSSKNHKLRHKTGGPTFFLAKGNKLYCGLFQGNARVKITVSDIINRLNYCLFYGI
jgi:hypothetical protein